MASRKQYTPEVAKRSLHSFEQLITERAWNPPKVQNPWTVAKLEKETGEKETRFESIAECECKAPQKLQHCGSLQTLRILLHAEKA